MKSHNHKCTILKNMHHKTKTICLKQDEKIKHKKITNINFKHAIATKVMTFQHQP